VLKDDADQPQFIRTVRRFGYAFCAPVTKQNASELPSFSGGGGWVIWGNRSIAIGPTESVLGRSLDADIRFDVPGVSRRHARILVDGQHVVLEDLGSQNGTYVRGERISGRATLVDGDEVRLGPVSIVFRQISADVSTLPM
jgi:hypothetical protein